MSRPGGGGDGGGDGDRRVSDRPQTHLPERGASPLSGLYLAAKKQGGQADGGKVASPGLGVGLPKEATTPENVVTLEGQGGRDLQEVRKVTPESKGEYLPGRRKISARGSEHTSLISVCRTDRPPKDLGPHGRHSGGTTAGPTRRRRRRVREARRQQAAQGTEARRRKGERRWPS